MRELRAQLNARVLEAKREFDILSPASRSQAFGYSHTSPHDSFAEEVNISPRDFIRRIHFYISLTSIYFCNIVSIASQLIPNDFIDTCLLKWSRDSVLSTSSLAASRAINSTAGLKSPARLSTSCSQTSPIAAAITSSSRATSTQAAVTTICQPDHIKSRMSLRHAEFMQSQHRSSLLAASSSSNSRSDSDTLSSSASESIAVLALQRRSRANEKSRPSLQVFTGGTNPIAPRELRYDFAILNSTASCLVVLTLNINFL